MRFIALLSLGLSFGLSALSSAVWAGSDQQLRSQLAEEVNAVAADVISWRREYHDAN